jgi:hypothetical protein
MRTLVGTFLAGACLVAGPALAQQNPWVPSCVYAGGCMYTGSLANGAPARAERRIRVGDIGLRHHSGRPRHSGDTSHSGDTK